MTTHVLDVLGERGFIQQISDEPALRRKLNIPSTLYIGYDATAPSLTAGHLVTIMLLSWFQRYGHRSIALLGGGTTLVGDPTGKQTARPMLTDEEIDRNLQSIKRQFGHFLDFSGDRALLLNNADWLGSLQLLPFLREIGTRFGVNDLLHLEAYQTRLQAGGLSFLEFSYALLQAYDFMHLYRTHDCVLQAGGSDQWGNCLAGADLIRRASGGRAFVLVSPLLVTANGTKMGKTERGAVWLDPDRTTPFEYYQFWRNTDDRDVERFLALFTFLPMEEVRSLTATTGSRLNHAKEVLAFEATSLVHGAEEASHARDAARALFAGQSADETSVPAIRLARERLTAGILAAELFAEAKLVTSRNEARTLIRQRGLAIDGQTLTDPHAQVRLADADGGTLLLSRGQKRHCRVLSVDPMA